MSKFEKIERELGNYIESCQVARKIETLNDASWSELNDQALFFVIESNFKNGNYEMLIDFLVAELCTDHGLVYFATVSRELIERKDLNRLERMWRDVIRVRKRNGHKKAAKNAVNEYLKILEQAGDIERYEKAKSEFLSTEKKTDVSKMTNNDSMNEQSFWNLIAISKEKSVSLYDRVEAMQIELLMFSPQSIAIFGQILNEKLEELNTWDLWAVAYLAFGGCSSDQFEFFRCWIISEGKSIFDAVSKNFESIISLNLNPAQMEHLQSLPELCFRLKSSDPYPTSASSTQAPKGREWIEDESELRKQYPLINKYFNELYQLNKVEG